MLLLDEAGRTFLFRFDVGTVGGPAGRQVWITPGGGVEPGESYEQAAVRELYEETGLTLPLGQCIWLRTHRMRFGERTIEQRERYYLVRTVGAEVVDTYREAIERKVLGDQRWWTAAEILDAASTHFAPRRLGELLSAIVEGDIPVEPIDVGV